MKRYIFGSKSPFLDGMVLYQKLATDSTDFSKENNNGVDTSMSYAGGYGEFDPGYITIPYNDADFVFTDGTNDIPFAVAFSFIWDDKSGDQFFFSKDTNVGCRISTFGSELFFTLWTNTSNRIFAKYIMGSFVNGTEYHMLFESDGSKSETGLYIYRNNSLIITAQTEIGTYTGMTTETENLTIGAKVGGTNILKGKMRNLGVWKNRNFSSAERLELYNRQLNNIPFI